jgi:hypothetical protein
VDLNEQAKQLQQREDALRYDVTVAESMVAEARQRLADFLKSAGAADDVPGLDNPTGQPVSGATTQAAAPRHLPLHLRRQAEARAKAKG